MQNNMETYTTSTQQLTLEDLIFSQEDSLVNRSAWQENERDQKTNATCGRRCLELSESVNPVGSWARTFAGLLIGRTDWYSKRVALTWKLLGTPSNRLLFQLVPSTLPTDATEFGLLLTPTTSEPVHDLEKFKARMEKYPNGTTMPNLATQVHGMLPTPTAHQQNTQFKQGGKCLQAHFVKNGMLPTPTTRDYKGARSEEALQEAGTNEKNSLPDAFAQSGKTSQLSPLFVEEMMGFPKNWTALPFQSGEENQSKHTVTP